MYKIHIGIEIHCELNTKTKMFSSAPVSNDDIPNTHVDVMSLAFPGYLPTVNEQAVRYGLLACQALHCTIDPHLSFDRKNYSYPDLPKGFQITQQFHPLGKNGYLMVNGNKVCIQRLHLEEDTAKLIHKGDHTLADFNRCGIPLIEIVTDAKIHSIELACAYVKTIAQCLVYLDITEGKMEKGQIRCDVNLSLSNQEEKLGTKVELKNLNSISHMKMALEYEVQRQSALLDQGQPVLSETRRFDEKEKKTVVLRQKETALDYRYFPEPNIPVIHLSKQWIEEVLKKRPKYPEEILKLLQEQGFSKQEAKGLMIQKDLTDFYFTVIKYTERQKDVFHILCTDVRNALKTQKAHIDAVNPQTFAQIINLLDQNISRSLVRRWILSLLEGHDVESEIKKALACRIDENQLNEWIEIVCRKQAQSVTDYQKGKTKALGYLVGQVLKVSKGQADPKEVGRLLKEKLNHETGTGGTI